MILKSYIIEKNLSPLDKIYASLFYGENIGLKDEIKEKITERYKNHEKIILYQNEIIKDEKILNDQIYNTSLFYSILCFICFTVFYSYGLRRIKLRSYCQK